MASIIDTILLLWCPENLQRNTNSREKLRKPTVASSLSGRRYLSPRTSKHAARSANCNNRPRNLCFIPVRRFLISQCIFTCSSRYLQSVKSLDTSIWYKSAPKTLLQTDETVVCGILIVRPLIKCIKQY